MKLKKKHKVILAIVVLLICIRLYLPVWVKNYANKVLDDVPGYSGLIEDVDLNLYRGAYKIQKLTMVKTSGKVPVPFLDIDEIDLSVHWKALFKGRIVGEIILEHPKVNFVAAVSDSSSEQLGGDADWTKPIKELMPLQINIFEVRNGEINYLDYSSEPRVDISLINVQAKALNLSNADRKADELPSTINLTANAFGSGNLSINSKVDLLREIPDFDIDAQIENVDLTALNDFTSAYAKLDFQGGTFNMYSEVAAKDGLMEGYLKPVLVDIDVFDLSEDHDKPLRMIWEAVAGAVTALFHNYPKDQFATKVPIKGDLNSPETKIWPTIANVFKNAFIHAFTKETDNTITFDEVIQK